MFPMLIISGCGVVMLMYNPNDVLLAPETLAWEYDIAFLVIWLSLHYHFFKTDEAESDELKCGFKEQFEKYVKKDKYIYLEPLFKDGSKERKKTSHLLPMP